MADQEQQTTDRAPLGWEEVEALEDTVDPIVAKPFEARNYYGSPRLYSLTDGRHFLCIEPESGSPAWVQVSADFASAWEREWKT